MSIGIYDADIMAYTLVPFNLQAMKLSAYYKRHREIVVPARLFTPERNSKFFYTKDWDDGKYPSSLNQSNVTYLGHAFTGNTYVPLDEDIELMKPDTSIYEGYRSIVTGNKNPFNKKVFDAMMNAEHIRLSLDNKTLWPRYQRQFKDIGSAKLIMLHDFNLGEVEGARDAVEDMLKAVHRISTPLKFGMKFPIKAQTGEELVEWANLPSDGIFYSLRYDGVLDNESFMRWVQIAIEKKNASLMEYNVVGNSSSQNDFVKNHLLNLYKQVVISRSLKLKLSLTYDNDFFIDKRWEKVIDFMNCYQHSCHYFNTTLFIRDAETDTAYDFAKAVKNTMYYDNVYPFSIQDIRSVFQFVKNESPELFDGFYNTNFNSLKGEYYDIGRNKNED